MSTIQHDVTCPNCARSGMLVFYEAGNIPVHSVILVGDRESALAYPKRDMVLGFCSGCGFISNTAFDSTVHDYSPQYEETQGFSPTFNAFARSLAERLINEHGLLGKRVIEIGCGKGEFITLLCELGMSGGVGIDPAYSPGRLHKPAANRVEFIQDFYDERFSHLEADLICCRHTLEHIGPTGRFLKTLRRNIGERTDTLVFFEVPDTLRILREAAFWDIYYEHCSYFTAGSLARLFRNSGFDLLDLRREYEGQYLTILARPIAFMSGSSFEMEADIAEVAGAVDAFSVRFASLRQRWVSAIQNRREQGKKIVLWGSGSKAVGFITTLGLGDQIEFVVDINPYKHEKYMPGAAQRIVAPEFLAEYRPDCVVVMNPVYMREIEDELKRMGIEAEIMSLGGHG